ncbi:hypothetical protein BBP40_009297 [Aspergillus hancockii]|nr:hypothetical protein BBP40_009297 [Aspergillus hancockii]
MTLHGGLYIIVPKFFDSRNNTDGVLAKNDDDEVEFREIDAKGTKSFIFYVAHVTGSSDHYRIYDGQHRKILYSNDAVAKPTFEIFDTPTDFADPENVETTDPESIWIIKKKDETEFGHPICKVKNKGSGNGLGGQLLEFRPAAGHISFLEAKRRLVVEDYKGRMRTLLDSIAKSNATGIPLSEYVSRLAQTGLANLDDPWFTGLSK